MGWELFKRITMKKLKNLISPETKVFEPGDYLYSFNPYGSSQYPLFRRGFVEALKMHKYKKDKKVKVYYYVNYRGDGTGYAVDAEFVFPTKKQAIQGYRDHINSERKTPISTKEFTARIKEHEKYHREWKKL